MTPEPAQDGLPATGMRPEDRLLLLCARRPFGDDQREAVAGLCRSTPLDWRGVYAAAVEQGIGPLVYAHLNCCSPAELGIPAEVVSRFRGHTAQALVNKLQLARQLVRALAYLRGQSLDAMLIKGAALDYLIYQQQALTTYRDVDLVLRVRREAVSKADQAAIASALYPNPIEFDFFDHHDVTLNGVLPVDFERVWRDALPIRFGEQPAWVMCPEDLLLAGCINAGRKRFVRLKALVDIDAILRAYPGLDWEALARKAHGDQCSYIVYTALLVVRRLLDAKVPEQAFQPRLARTARAAAIRFLAGRLSRHSWTKPHAGWRVLNRDVGPALVLPYLTYRWDQIGRKLRFVWRSRDGVAGV